jgi:hypothetical protein
MSNLASRASVWMGGYRDSLRPDCDGAGLAGAGEADAGRFARGRFDQRLSSQISVFARVGGAATRFHFSCSSICALSYFSLAK